MTIRTRTLGAGLAASMLVCTSTAVAADAPRFPDDRATHGVGAVALTSTPMRPDDHARHGVGATIDPAPAPVSAARPDDRASTRGPGAFVTAATVVRTDDRAGVRGPGATDAPVVVTRSAGGFDWSDAGIGAFGGAGIALLLIGAVALVASRRDDTHIALR